jgi:tricarboxylate carrier
MASPSPGYPPFDPDNSRFNLGSYWGRLNQVMVQFDPRKLLCSNAELQQNILLLKQHKEGVLKDGVTDEDLWKAKDTIAARTHPDTGESIPIPFCFAAYVPMQPPIIVGMLWPGGGVPLQVLMQWYNQSYNSLTWYYNKNQSTPMTNAEVFRAYASAVGVSIGLSVGMRKIGEAMPPGKLGSLVRGAAPFTGVVAAGCTSLVLMRLNELTQGVQVRDAEGESYGLSKNAAREGIAKCCLARFVWNIPILGLGPVVSSLYNNSAFHARNPRFRLLNETLMLTSCVCLGIFPAQALFTQEASIPSSRLEERFKNKGVDQFFYNKGL